MSEISKQEIKLFYCYAREDKALRDELEKHLHTLKRLYPLRNWHDREILPGEEWEQAIDTHLNTAHLILLLVSPDFMNSDYCYGKEMQRALERHGEGTCKVIPIILRPTYLEAAPFSTLQMLPTDAKPITRWLDRDEAFHDVVKEISLVLKDLLLSLKTKKDWLEEGIFLRDQKRYDRSLEAFEQALRLDPIYLEAHQEKGKTLFDLKRYDYALEAFEQALCLDMNLVPLYIAKGQTLDTLERYEEALAAFEQAIRLDPNLVGAYIGRDKVLQHLGISRKAQEKLASQLQQTQHQLTEQQKRLEQLESELEQLIQVSKATYEQLDLSKKIQEELASQLEKTQQQLATQQKRSEQLESQLAQAPTLPTLKKFYEGVYGIFKGSITYAIKLQIDSYINGEIEAVVTIDNVTKYFVNGRIYEPGIISLQGRLADNQKRMLEFEGHIEPSGEIEGTFAYTRLLDAHNNDLRQFHLK